MRLRFFLPGLLMVAAGLLTACEDPSNVGIGLVDDTGGAPIVRTLAPEEIVAEPRAAASGTDITGQPPPRFLAGAVADPLLGTTRTTAYIDFAPGADDDPSDAFRAGPTTSAELHLGRVLGGYVYGDTTATITLRLLDMLDEWDPRGARSDTTFPTGEVVSEVTIPVADTLVVIPLPEAWVQANEAALRGEDFTERIHGFALEAVSETAVVGYTIDSTVNPSLLRVFAGGDSLDYFIPKVLTNVEGAPGPTRLPGLRLVQTNGQSLRTRFDFSALADTVGAVNRALMQYVADTVAVQQDLPPNFVRPTLRRASLFAIDEGREGEVAEVPVDSVARLTFSTGGLTAEVQQLILGREGVTDYRLAAPPPNNGLVDVSVLLVHDLDAAETAPEAVLTITPIID